MPELKGTVVRLVSDKGFGLIKRADAPVEYFFHRAELDGVDFEALREGVAVAFDESSSLKGPRARNVVIAP